VSYFVLDVVEQICVYVSLTLFYYQVSPYNLWIVRAFRAFSSLFLTLSFVWWTFLLVSIFVSPPMMHSRGAGFFSFAYTTLTVSYLIIALLFFTVPSKAMTISGLVLSVFLFVDMCIILGVPQLRVEEGWVGIASVVWATLISIFNILQSQAVAWAKKKEEERLTGREETRRSLQEWIAVLLDTIFMVVIAIVSIIFTATLIMRAWDASLPAPGQKYLVNGEKYQVHLACVGRINGTTDGNGNRPPTVLLEGGEGPVEHSLQPFIDEVYKQGLIDRYCYWDRPGYAWSDNAPSPHSLHAIFAASSSPDMSCLIPLSSDCSPETACWYSASRLPNSRSLFSRSLARLETCCCSALFTSYRFKTWCCRAWFASHRLDTTFCKSRLSESFAFPFLRFSYVLSPWLLFPVPGCNAPA
jgi:hypothetical protein